MNIDFENIEYLKNGTARQKLAYESLTNHKIMIKLNRFDPVLAGTIPINIDIEESDLDIICYFRNRNEFISEIKNNFTNFENFKIHEPDEETDSVFAVFRIDNFDVEIFGQNIPTKQQNAYRHMLIEHKLLCERNSDFRQKIIDLKRQGYKTEPAFGVLLGLTGDPYVELLKYRRTGITD